MSEETMPQATGHVEVGEELPRDVQLSMNAQLCPGEETAPRGSP